MNRLLSSGLLAAALLLAPALAGPAVAAPTATPTASPSHTVAPTITARGGLVFLGGDPWSPSGPLEVSVRNSGITAAKGFFMLRLPESVDLTSGADCRADADTPRTWLCGGAELPARGERTYRLTVLSSHAEPVFGVKAWGSVAGRNATGITDGFTEFRINWPDRTSVGLRATATPVVDGTTRVRVRVTNTGSFDIGGYSLAVTTPAGVRVTAPGCSDSGRMNGVGCEILRPIVLTAGTIDSFDVHLTVTGGEKTVRLSLTPAQRYTNRDTTVTLRLGGTGGSGAGDTPTPSPDPTATAATPSPSASVPSASTTQAEQLPRTGPSGGAYALVGAAMLALGAGLLVLRRRLSRG
ncbi:LPXTG cell wall anchor domain-containing protein [Micromonospora chokoriensis]|uniref:LPXTG-motif cell wall anchor domain-containing protein n=1 Tax=Micromonospora chokoriensis TaxID=356851 RepID=A0A1C4Z9L4_9ACTN|nr:LPXTG cell wall anchor domain-containing protein [Micromonospora chokoriensis]SCF29618.1 LPXTG-motif cell wall anchor domain-containing protein [Micromonospora chokoriensis]